MFCPQCGSSNDDEYAFCRKCGASLRRGETPAAAVQGPPPGAYTQPPAGYAAIVPVSPAAGQATEYAGFGWRFLAVFLDGILVGVVSNLFGLMLGVVVGVGGVAAGVDEDALSLLAGLMGAMIGVGIAWMYEAFMVSSSRQATFGKMAFGIVVTDMEGRRISFARATGRHFGKIVSSLLLMAGYLMQPFTERRQALHDMMAGCLVLRKVPR